jgi:hypothetical protein
VLAAVNDKPFGRPQEGPSLTAAARGGQTYLRSGRKNACGAVEQKNGLKLGEQHEATGTFSMRQQLRFGEHSQMRQYDRPR